MTTRHGSASTRSEQGSSVVEFVLVMVILLPLLLGVLQLGLFLHVRNTLVACAHEGAREAANYDGDLATGRATAQECIGSALSAGMARQVTARMTDAGAQPVVVVEVTANMPSMGLWGPTFGFSVQGHAVKETLT